LGRPLAVLWVLGALELPSATIDATVDVVLVCQL
jgi:hypothetical protein